MSENSDDIGMVSAAFLLIFAFLTGRDMCNFGTWLCRCVLFVFGGFVLFAPLT